MRHAILASAALALTTLTLAGCDDDGHMGRHARTASATQCAPSPLPACAPGKASGDRAAGGHTASTGIVATTSGSGSSTRVTRTEVEQDVRVRTERHRGHYRRGGNGYAQVEHYGYVDGGQVREDAYASGDTTRRASRTVVSQSSRYSESGYASGSSSSSSGSYASGGGYASGGSYASGGAWQSSGHQGRLVIRGGHGQADSWTWRTAGRDERGMLTWPGKTPD
ncbi:MAG: hypothetical protein JWP35_4447 [Caulobacter sp.]|nr:hypothetical protein [Caulobacter sp.]